MRGILGYVVAMAVLATLAPFDFQSVPGRSFALLFLADDVVLNLLLLFPVGFLFALAMREAHPLAALAIGLGLSLALESAQLWLPSRHANLVDVISNAAGCWAGALLARRLSRFLSGFLSEELVLELPLTGALYVLLPLLMLLGLHAGSGLRAYRLVPLAMFAAVILVALYQERLGRAGLPPERFAAYCGAGVLALALPTLIERPLPVLAAAACMSASVWIAVRRRLGWVPPQRRFEASTVRRGLPWIGLYLAASAVLAWLDRAAGRAPDRGQDEALALLEVVATLTTYGYLASELTARTRAPAAAWVVAIAASGLPLGTSLSFDWLAKHGVVSRCLCLASLALAAAAGAGLHRAQIELVRAIRGRSGPPSRRPRAP